LEPPCISCPLEAGSNQTAFRKKIADTGYRS
jgi:hypothetical protein